MKRPDLWATALASAWLSVAACGCAPANVEDLGTAVSAALNLNALNLNALNLNALNLNALNLNALNLNALDATALTALEDPGPNGDLARQLAKYAASCALDSTQSFDFAWTDSLGVVHDESYPGLLGLATSWATGPLDAAGQRWVSACLVSRVNYLGVTVSLSSRGWAPGLATSPSEVAAYGSEEGAFWGNLFAATPTAYACDRTDDDANSRAQDRFCAAGYVGDTGTVQSCGMIQRLGSCDGVCAPLITPPTASASSGAGGQFHPRCDAQGFPSGTGAADPGATPQVITVFLP